MYVVSLSVTAASLRPSRPPLSTASPRAFPHELKGIPESRQVFAVA